MKSTEYWCDKCGASMKESTFAYSLTVDEVPSGPVSGMANRCVVLNYDLCEVCFEGLELKHFAHDGLMGALNLGQAHKELNKGESHV